MGDPSTTQLRLIYSLLKPAIRMASRFRIPMRTLSELARLAYYEHLRHEGLSQSVIGQRLGQSERHMRSLEQKLKGDFAAAEKEIGVAREIENQLSRGPKFVADLLKAYPESTLEAIETAVEELVQQGRAERTADEKVMIARRYVLLASDQFEHRVDALNNFLDATYRALVHRLIYDEKDPAMIKTIHFSAKREALVAFARTLEADLRLKISQLEEDAQFQGEEERFALALSLSPVEE